MSSLAKVSGARSEKEYGKILSVSGPGVYHILSVSPASRNRRTYVWCGHVRIGKYLFDSSDRLGACRYLRIGGRDY
jgi:hypothetical protein